MAEYMLLRMAMVGISLGLFVLTIMVGKGLHAVWRYWNQRREPRV